MSGLGTQRVAGQRWRNPASPDVLREFGDGDVFISSASSPHLGLLSYHPNLPLKPGLPPSTLPVVFVRDSPEYLRSQAEIAATLGLSKTIKGSSRAGSVMSTLPTFSRLNKGGARQSQLGRINLWALPMSKLYPQLLDPQRILLM